MAYEEDLTQLTKTELQKRVGDFHQLAYVELGEKLEGSSREIRAASFRTAKGLYFKVLIDRAMDISSLYVTI